MTHTYKISGMTCGGCQAKVKSLLSGISGVKEVLIDLGKGEASISMDHHIATGDLQAALKDYPKYQLTEKVDVPEPEVVLSNETSVSWLTTYKPILLIFGYILLVTLAIEWINGSFVWKRWMEHFMAGFFLVFSFFKLLDLKAFAESYATYDIIARKWSAWGYLYAVTELLLGIAFLTGWQPLLTNAVTFGVMSVSIKGVLRSVLSKRKIRCACLGAVFNLPMSTITIIEDALMIGMSAAMLITMLLG